MEDNFHSKCKEALRTGNNENLIDFLSVSVFTAETFYNVNLKNECYNAGRKGNIGMFNILEYYAFKNGRDLNLCIYGTAALNGACNGGRYQMFHSLCIDFAILPTNETFQNACAGGNVDIIEFTRRRSLPDKTQAAEGVLIACLNNHPDAVKKLLEVCKVEITSIMKRTSAFVNLEPVKCILAHFTLITPPQLFTCFKTACYSDINQDVPIFIANRMTPANFSDWLIHAATRGRFEVVAHLLQTNRDLQTPLLMHILFNVSCELHADVAIYVLDHTRNPLVQDCLVDAVIVNNLKLVMYIVEQHCVNMDEDQRAIVLNHGLLAAQTKITTHTRIVRYLIDNGGTLYEALRCFKDLYLFSMYCHYAIGWDDETILCNDVFLELFAKSDALKWLEVAGRMTKSDDLIREVGTFLI